MSNNNPLLFAFFNDDRAIKTNVLCFNKRNNIFSID